MFGILKPTIDIARLWRDEYLRNENSYDVILKKDEFRGWELSSAPDGPVTDCLTIALGILYGRGDETISRKFLDRGLRIAGRIHAEGRLDPKKYPVSAGGWPLSNLWLAQAEGYLRLVRFGTLDTAMLLRWTDVLPDGIKQSRKTKFMDFADFYALVGMRVALICDKPKQALSLYQTMKKFHVKENAEHAAVLAEIADVAEEGPLRDERLRKRFHVVFDGFRPPVPKKAYYCQVSTTRFELALINEKYFLQPSGGLDVSRAILSVPGAAK